MGAAAAKETIVIHSTLAMERNYPKPPKRVFSAFSSFKQKRRWLAGSEGADSIEMCKDGRRKLLDALTAELNRA